jgi:hypothetical protein
LRPGPPESSSNRNTNQPSSTFDTGWKPMLLYAVAIRPGYEKTRLQDDFQMSTRNTSGIRCAPIIPYPTGRFFGGTLSQALRARLRSVLSLRDNKSPQIQTAGQLVESKTVSNSGVRRDASPTSERHSSANTIDNQYPTLYQEAVYYISDAKILKALSSNQLCKQSAALAVRRIWSAKN